MSDRDKLVAVIDGLAHMAAMTRSPALADEVVRLVRTYYDSRLGQVQIQEGYRIMVVAAACSDSLDDWCERLGKDLTWLAYQLEGPEEATDLRNGIEWLCHLVPMLWPHCSRALAATKAVQGT